MARLSNADEVIESMRTVRQTRQFTDQAVSDEDTRALLQVARWTGSSRNDQPWHFIAITEPAQMQAISEARPPIGWVAGAPLGIAIVLNGDAETSEAYDEGRVTERILVAARALGLAGGVAWFGGPDEQAKARQTLGVPDGRTARAVVAIGYAQPPVPAPARPSPVAGGRRPFDEVVSWNSLGTLDETID